MKYMQYKWSKFHRNAAIWLQVKVNNEENTERGEYMHIKGCAKGCEAVSIIQISL